MVALDNALAADKILHAMKGEPQGLSIEDIMDICGIKRNTAYQNLRDLFNFQQIVEIRSKDRRLYRLREYDEAINDLAIAYPEPSRRGEG